VNRPPAFQLYAKDVLAVLPRLTHRAGYALLATLADMWHFADDHASSEADDQALARSWGVVPGEVQAVIAELKPATRFVRLDEDGSGTRRLVSDYLAERADEQRRFRERQAEKGRKGGRPKKAPANPGKSPGFAADNPGKSSDTLSSDSLSSPPPAGEQRDCVVSGLEQWFEDVGRTLAPADAKALDRLQKDYTDDEIDRAIEKAWNEEARKQQGPPIDNPLGYLRGVLKQQRAEDEAEAESEIEQVD
jgi:hypothetical protein